MNSRKKELFDDIYEYIKKIVDRAIDKNKKIILWGFAGGGKWVKYLIEEIDGRIKVDFIIDKMKDNIGGEIIIRRPVAIHYVKASDCIILSTIKNISDISGELSEIGYILGENLIDVRATLGNSYYDHLEKNYKDVDFSPVFQKDLQVKDIEKSSEYAPMAGRGTDIVFPEIVKLTDNHKFFDYGCGKGSAILQAYIHGIDMVAGVEIDANLCKQAEINLSQFSIPHKIFHEDATIFYDIDEYNIFFFYNPFKGYIFKEVIHNIEDSYRRNKRQIYIVYVNPFEHCMVVENGLFHIYKQIEVDEYDPVCNIYYIV